MKAKTCYILIAKLIVITCNDGVKTVPCKCTWKRRLSAQVRTREPWRSKKTERVNDPLQYVLGAHAMRQRFAIELIIFYCVYIRKQLKLDGQT